MHLKIINFLDRLFSTFLCYIKQFLDMSKCLNEKIEHIGRTYFFNDYTDDQKNFLIHPIQLLLNFIIYLVFLMRALINLTLSWYLQKLIPTIKVHFKTLCYKYNTLHIMLY